MKLFQRLRDIVSQQRTIPSEKNGSMIVERHLNGMWGIEYRNEYQSSGDYVEKMWRGALQAIEFEKRTYKKILVLGSGGGCVLYSMQKMLGPMRRDTEIIAIDWDSVMLQMSMAVYGDNFLQNRNLSKLINFIPSENKDVYSVGNVTLLRGDAKDFILKSQDFFDFIIIDVFHDTRPAQCMYEDVFRDALSTRLSPCGSAIINCWRSQDELRDIWQKSFIIEKEVKSHWNNLLYMKPRYAAHQ